MTLSSRLKERRKELKLNQEDIANKIHVSRQTISNWETGKTLPDISSLVLISESYQLSLDELLNGDQEVKEKIEKENQELKDLRLNRQIKKKFAIIGLILSMLASAILWGIYLFNYTTEYGALPLMACAFTGIIAILFLEGIENRLLRRVLLIINSLVTLSFPLLFIVWGLLGA